MALTARREANVHANLTGDARSMTGAFSNAYNAMQPLGPLADKTERSMALFAASMVGGKIGRAMEAGGKKILELGKSMAESAMTFEKNQRFVRTQTEMTDKQFDRMNTRVLKLAKNIPLPLESISEGLYDVLSSMDINTRGAIKLTGKLSKAAVGGSTDIRTVARSTIGALNAFDIPAKRVGRVLDTQFQLVRIGVGEYEDFINVLGQVYPSAVAAGQSLEDMSATLAFTTRNGMNAAQAGTSVARAMDMLSRPNYAKKMKDKLGIDVIDQATGEYKRLHVIIGEFAKELDGLTKPQRKARLAEVFGAGEIRANRFFNIAIDKTKQLTDMTSRFGESNKGAMQEAFETMAASTSAMYEKVKSHLAAIGVELGQLILPEIQKGIDLARELFEWFDKLPKPVKQLVVQVGLLSGVFLVVGGKIIQFAAALAGAHALMGMAGLSWGGLIGTLAGGIAKLLVVSATLVAIGFAIYEVSKHFDAFRDAWNRNWKNILAIAVAGAAILTGLFVSLQSMGLAPALKGFAGLGALLTGGFKKAMTSARMSTLLTKGALIAGALAVANFARSFGNAKKQADEWHEGLDDGSLSVGVYAVKVSEMAKQTEGFKNKFGDMVGALTKGEATATQTWNAMINKVAELRASMDDLTPTQLRITQAQANFTEALLKTEEVKFDSKSSSADIAAALLRQKAAEDTYREALKMSSVATAEATIETEKLRQTRRRLAGLADTVLEAELNTRDARRALADATKIVRELEEKGVTKGRKYKEAVDAMTRAELSLREARRNSREVSEKFLDNMDAAAGMSITNVRAFKRLGEMYGLNEKQLKKLIENTATGTVQLGEMGEKANINERAMKILHQALEVLHTSTDKQSEKSKTLWGRFKDVAAAANNIPDMKHTPVTADTSQAEAAVKSWIDRLRQQRVVVDVTAGLRNVNFGGPQFHSGGRIGGSGDTPIVAEGGEYVINKRSASRFGPLLESINKYHNGGMVGSPRVHANFGPLVAGMKQAISNFSMGSIVGAGRMIQKLGFHVSEHPLFGGVLGKHARNSYHYLGRAIDVNFRPAGQEPAMLDKLYTLLKSIGGYKELLWRVKDHFGHLHLAMAGGGVINEPVYGVGKSGRSYSFGERGPETVTPGVGGERHIHFHSVGQLDQKTVQMAEYELDWAERVRGW